MSRPPLVWKWRGRLIGWRADSGRYAIVKLRRDGRPFMASWERAPAKYSLLGEFGTLAAAKAACERHWQGGGGE